MKALKCASQVASVGLLALSLSVGFSGLALAYDSDNPGITVSPNPVVLHNNGATTNNPSGNSFDTVAEGEHVTGGQLYHIIVGSNCVAVFPGTTSPAGSNPSGVQMANSNGRVTFLIRGDNCQHGEYQVTLLDNANAPVAHAAFIVMSPRDDDAVPHQEANAVPHQEANVVPHQEANAVPHQEANAVPHQEANVVPHQEANVVPHQEADVSYEEADASHEEADASHEESDFPFGDSASLFDF